MKYLLSFLLATAAAADSKKKIVATIGDSITEGLSFTSQYKDKNYPITLGKMLGDGYEVKNFGAAGNQMMKGGW